MDTTSPDQIIHIPLNQLHDSPWQPRKTYDAKALQELADTMRPPHGRVLQPVVVRVPAQSPRPLLDGVDTFTDYELVFGHRRKRAAELAGLASMPAIVTTMTDEDVQRAQIIENLARADVHAIEEAEGFQALMQNHGITADQLVADTGKSRSYIYGRLKLLQAIPEVREACLAGEFGSETALLIARLRDPKLQKKALQALAGKNISLTDGGTKSFREARSLLARMFTLDLGDAIFSTTDDALVPSAGACTTCPKLSGNAAEFEDIAQGFSNHWGQEQKPAPKRCTDPTCWDAKHAAHLKQAAEALRAQGATVVDGNKAKAALSAYGEVKGAYVALDAKLKAALKKAGNKTAEQAQVLIQDPKSGKTLQAVPRAALGAEAAAAGLSRHSGHNQAEYEAQARERRARYEAAEKAHAALQARVREKLASQERTLFDLRLIVETIIGDCGHPQFLERVGFAAPYELNEAIQKLDGAALSLLLLDYVMWQYDDAMDPPADSITHRLAKHYGIQDTGLLADTTEATEGAGHATAEG
jgi:ParB/RepB/Spo0J family partition protein